MFRFLATNEKYTPQGVLCHVFAGFSNHKYGICFAKNGILSIFGAFTAAKRVV
jgi:hypothetical protein